jgi:phage terminase small subunit
MKGIGKKPRSWDSKRNRGRNIATALPVRILTKIPKPPKDFSPAMREIWKQTAEDLVIMGVFTTQSLIPLETYCYAVENMRTTQRDKKAKATTKTAQVKEVRVAAETLGLTPASHSKLKKPTAAGGSTSEDDRKWLEIIGETENKRGSKA